ncbi:hypothetical protein ONZ45_g15060 [Pleurotus djamor]|nr:hypothetical protein ONZ45_g15060 [Pleurotus djamor]
MICSGSSSQKVLSSSIYLDDILIYTKDREEHCCVLKRVLQILKENKLYLQPEKCKFEQTKVEYLGVLVSEGKVEMDPAKVAGVREQPVPRNVTELQSFVGFEVEQAAFDQLKLAITSEPILALPHEDRPYCVEADSSDFATGAVLSQLDPTDQKWHPVAYYSKSLQAAERNYEIHDKEMLSIIHALEEWRHLLEGATPDFEIWTDHKNLEYFMKAQKLNH